MQLLCYSLLTLFCYFLVLQDSPEFDLVFDSTVDQWVANSSAEKCIFVQILYHACQAYWKGTSEISGKSGKLSKSAGNQSAPHQGGPGPSLPQASASRTPKTLKSHVLPRPTEFINCQSKLTRGSIMLGFLMCWKLFICESTQLQYVVHLLEASTINLFIYRCRAFLNRMKNVMMANQRTPGQGMSVFKGGLGWYNRISYVSTIYYEENML